VQQLQRQYTEGAAAIEALMETSMGGKYLEFVNETINHYLIFDSD
jgi:hypothetical protein